MLVGSKSDNVLEAQSQHSVSVRVGWWCLLSLLHHTNVVENSGHSAVPRSAWRTHLGIKWIQDHPLVHCSQSEGDRSFTSHLVLHRLTTVTFGVLGFYFALKLAPWKPLFHLKVSTVLSISSYFCLPTQFISAWLFQFWHLCIFSVIPAEVHHERESANVVIKEGFKYFSWEWAKLEEQLASMVVEFPIENVTSVVILVTDQSCR